MFNTNLEWRSNELIGMARPFAFGQWDKYYDLVCRTFPKMNTNLLLPFEDATA
jgi:hypothetical protein